MIQILMIYSIPNGNHSTRISFNRELFDYRVQSHGGKYDKKSDGILKKYEKPVRSTVIFNKEYLEKVQTICKKHKIKTEFYQIKKIVN